MRGKCRFKKSIALVVAVAMVLGLAPVIPGNIYNRALADTAAAGNGTTAQKPSVQVYADKDTLMGDTFDPGSDGTQAKAVAKLKFGMKTVYNIYTQDEEETPIEWYILGKDDQVKDKNNKTDNIAIFVKDEIMVSNGVFTRADKKLYYSGDGVKDEEYVKGTRQKGDTLAYNHYGESDVREILREMAGDTEYFTEREQDLMQKTKVLTHECDNEDMLYTTNDKLYLASGKYKDTVIYVGSTGTESVKDEYTSKMLPYDTYWKMASVGGSDLQFWLRSPGSGSRKGILGGPTSGSVGGTVAGKSLGCVRPASNLDLSSVRFASAAKTTSTAQWICDTLTTSDELDDDGYIVKKQDAMTLRLDGKDQNIGKIDYTSDTIMVQKGSTESDVSIVVQGNDGTNDWYYSKLVTDTETISVSTIASALNNLETAIDTTSIDPTSDECKIWLEIPVKDEDGTVSSTLSYAIDKNTHTHVYPTDKATPTELMHTTATGHSWQCIADDCPDKEDSYIKMNGEKGEDPHSWVDSADKVDTEKDPLDKYKVPTTADKTNPYYRANGDICEEVTTYYYYCRDCEYYDTSRAFEYVKQDKHNYNTEYSEDGWTPSSKTPEQCHVKFCLNCLTEIASEEHKYDPDKSGKCTVCGYDDTHECGELTEYEAKSATCEERGNIRYFKCEKCGLLSSDRFGIVRLSEGEIYTKPLGHNLSVYSTANADSTEHWQKCANCGGIFNKAAHTFSGNKCTTCGYTKTSDNSNSGYRGTTYSDGSTRNSDRYSSVSSGASQNSFSSSSSSGLTASSNSASGWSQDASGRWWYYDGNAKIVGWVYDKSDSKWYYVDAEKGRVYGWFYDTEDGYWYYLDANTGAMLTGWQLIGGKQYYFATAPAAATYTFDTSSAKWVYSNAANYRPYGSMYAGTTTPDNHSVDADGAKVQ